MTLRLTDPKIVEELKEARRKDKMEEELVEAVAAAHDNKLKRIALGLLCVIATGRCKAPDSNEAKCSDAYHVCAAAACAGKDDKKKREYIKEAKRNVVAASSHRKWCSPRLKSDQDPWETSAHMQ